MAASPPASPTACQSTSAARGARAGQPAAASNVGAGPASSAARIASPTASRSAGYTTLPVPAQGLAQDLGVILADRLDKPGQRRGPIVAAAQRLDHRLGDQLLPGRS